jgi:transposase-like protein
MAKIGAKDDRAKRARRRFTDEFKAGAVRLVLDEGKTVAEVARDLDPTASALGGWVNTHARISTPARAGSPPTSGPSSRSFRVVFQGWNEYLGVQIAQAWTSGATGTENSFRLSRVDGEHGTYAKPSH